MLIETYGTTAIAIVLTNLVGELHGQAFAGNYRYVRTWMHSEQGWRIIAGSVCAVPD